MFNKPQNKFFASLAVMTAFVGFAGADEYNVIQQKIRDGSMQYETSNKIYAYYEQLNNKSMAQVYIDLANLYKQQNDADKAKFYMMRARQLYADANLGQAEKNKPVEPAPNIGAVGLNNPAGNLANFQISKDPTNEGEDKLQLAKQGLKGDLTAQKKAVLILKEAGFQGQGEAHYILGNLSIEGRIVPQDWQEARNYFTKARQLGYAPAQAMLEKINKGSF